MRLEDAIEQSKTCEEFCRIFRQETHVEIDTFWGCDTVRVAGYQGVVSTDLIARRVIQKFDIITDEKSATELGDLLKNKVFIPLRDRLIKLDQQSCTSTLLYKIRNCARMSYTPQDLNLSAGYYVLKHSICVMYLYVK